MLKGNRPKFKILFVAIAVAVVWVATMQSTNAIEFVQRNEFLSSEAETLRDELWISAQSITISGHVLNDLFAVGSTLDLRGDFQGDVWAGGNTVIAAGRFADHVRLASRSWISML